jgi:hypothetical protein
MTICFALSLLAFVVTIGFAEVDPDQYSPVFPALGANFVYCRIAKSGSTPATRFLLRVTGDERWATASVHSHNITSLGRMTEAARQEILSNHSITRVVIARDPLERFASGYLDKCMKLQDFNCPVKGAARKSVDAVLTALERTGVSTPACNGHFRSAISVCNLNNSLHEYTVVPYVYLADGWIDVVSRIEGISAARKKILAEWAKEIFDPLHGSSKRLKKAALHHRTQSMEVVAKWRSAASRGDLKAASILSRVYRLYAEDYAMFHEVPGVIDPRTSLPAAKKALNTDENRERKGK